MFPVVRWRGRTAAWFTRSSAGIVTLAFDQHLVELHLHAGSEDPGGSGWRFGPAVSTAEREHLAAAFNGAFRLGTGSGGFFSYGRTAVRLRDGLGSIVTYSDGTTDVGTWNTQVPTAGKTVLSVRQNLDLLIDQGRSAATVACNSCWGATLGGVAAPARAALGISADGRLIWVAGEHFTVSALAQAVMQAGAVRAVELDINPEWVAAYLYAHRGPDGPLTAVAVVPGQAGIPGQFLLPWKRDFFTVVAR